jgi:hypothetical protein
MCKAEDNSEFRIHLTVIYLEDICLCKPKHYNDLSVFWKLEGFFGTESTVAGYSYISGTESCLLCTRDGSKCVKSLQQTDFSFN